MVVAYVQLAASPSSKRASRVYGLLLPDPGDGISELHVQRSSLGGVGVYPDAVWSQYRVPFVMPYFGMENVVHDETTVDLLMDVLKGSFQCTTVGEVISRHGANAMAFVADGLFAVQSMEPEVQSLPVDTRLLQVGMRRGRCYYLLEADAITVLHLGDDRAYLYDLLRAHASNEHTDRTLCAPHPSLLRC
jgi:hypothetical protein